MYRLLADGARRQGWITSIPVKMAHFLAGANKDDMLKKMMDFKTGKKPATIMHQLSKGYTDEQLAALATYFSSLKK